jgi:hypothetical protein
MLLLMYVLSLVLLSVAVLDAGRQRMRLCQQLAGERLLVLRSGARFAQHWIIRSCAVATVAGFLAVVVANYCLFSVLNPVVSHPSLWILLVLGVVYWQAGLVMWRIAFPQNWWEMRERGLVGRDAGGAWFMPWDTVRAWRWDAAQPPRLIVHCDKVTYSFSVLAEQQDEVIRVLRSMTGISDCPADTATERASRVVQMGPMTAPKLVRKRWQFTLRNALLWLLFFSALFSLIGMLQRLGEDERQAFAQMQKLSPTSNTSATPHFLNLSAANAPLHDEDLTPLDGLRHLRGLALAGHPITDAGLAHVAECRHLSFLDLSRTKVTDAGLAHLEKLKSLGAIDLRGTQVTPQGVARLKAALPGARISY